MSVQDLHQNEPLRQPISRHRSHQTSDMIFRSTGHSEQPYLLPVRGVRLQRPILLPQEAFGSAASVASPAFVLDWGSFAERMRRKVKLTPLLWTL
jgi:hypothetical protein